MPIEKVCSPKNVQTKVLTYCEGFLADYSAKILTKKVNDELLFECMNKDFYDTSIL